MISSTQLQELKARLRESVVLSLEDTFALLKESLPADTERMGEVLSLEGQYQDYQKDKLRRTLSSENEQLIGNQIRSNLVDLIAALTEDDFEPVSRSVSLFSSRKKVLYLLLALLTGSVLVVAFYELNTEDFADWFNFTNKKSGHLLYKIPPVMQVNNPETCLVRISFDSVSLVRNLKQDDVKVEEIPVTEMMKVELIAPQADPAFRISNILGDDKQYIESGDHVEWQFRVTPLRTGNHKLILKVSTMNEVGGKYVPTNKTLNRAINIVAEPVDRAETSFENTGQIISPSSGTALVNAIERERADLGTPPLTSPNNSTSGGSPSNNGEVQEINDDVQIAFLVNSVEPILDQRVNDYLHQLAARVQQTNETITLIGHTDINGDTGNNVKIGLRRAQAVRDVLIKLGVAGENIQVKSEGTRQPIAPNDTESGRAQNRRVEIRLIRRG